MIFRARQIEFSFPRPSVVMGIVNVTPDSFSDGGNHLDAGAAVAHGLKLVADGAEILDIGGESTRPGAMSVPEEEELRRVVPVIEMLAARTKVPLSIDSMKPAVARAALAAGASIVNDVAASRSDRDMWRVVADYQAGYVVMHGRRPAEEPPAGRCADVVREVDDFFAERLGALLKDSGIAAEQVVLDPGIGFGKTLEQTLQLLAGLRNFAPRRRPLLLGVSRKSFIEKVTGAAVNQRLPASLACATLAVASGAQIIRAHDVAETVQAVRMAEAIMQKSHVD
jgi:dihydropteroate synthase